MAYLRMHIERIYRLARDYQLDIVKLSILILVLIGSPAFSPAEDVKPGENIKSPDATAAVTATPEGTSEEEKENTDVAKALEDLLKTMNLGNFEYKTEERPDPFMPFISDKVINPSETDSETGERLTGMRQFEPGQLNLVAIMFTETNPMAMMEDSSHKGYLVRRGTKIGKTGVVTDILPNEVIIKQLSYSMDQTKKYSTMEMILRKEGEK